MKNIFLCLTKANVLQKTWGGDSPNQTDDTLTRQNRIGVMSGASRRQAEGNASLIIPSKLLQIWKYAACLLIAFFVGVGNVLGADFTPADIVAGASSGNISVSTSASSTGTAKLCTTQTSVADVPISNAANGDYNANYIEIKATSGTISSLSVKMRGNSDGASNPIVAVFWEGDASGTFSSKSEPNFINRATTDCDAVVDITVPSGTKTIRLYRQIKVSSSNKTTFASSNTTSYPSSGNTFHVFGISATAASGCAAADLTAANIKSNGDQIVGTGITFQKEGTPASGDTWYWQTSATGTDKTHNASSENYTTATTAGSYTAYLRAYNSGADCWGTAISKTNTIISCPFDVYNGENVDKGKTTASGWTINSSSSMAKTSGSSNGYSYWYQTSSNSGDYVQFDGSIALAKDDQIKIQWTHTNGSSKTLQLRINGSLATLTSGSTASSSNLVEAVYDVPSAITVTSIKLNSSGSQGCIIYQVSIIKAACAEPSCSAPTIPTISGTTDYTEGEDISLTASATGTDGSTTYTWYKGTTWDAAFATSSIGSAATFTKNSCVEGDAGTYWCNISNGTGCEVHVSKTITVAAASCTEVAAPTGLSCTGHTSASLTFGWTAAEHASSYDVKLWDNSACTGEPVASENVTTTSKTFTTLNDETTYYCKVQSKGDGVTYCTDGGKTDAVSGTTDALPSYTVTAVTSTGDNTRGTVSAAASSVKMGGTTTITAVPAAGYRVSVWTASGTGVSIDPAGLSHSTTATLTVGTSDVTVTVSFEEIPCPTSGTVFKMEALKLCTCTIASKTTYPLTSSDNYTITGGALELSNVGSSQKVLMTKNQSSLIQWNWNTNDVGFHITTTCPLQAGDTIKYTTNQTAYDVYINEEASKGSSSDSTIKADSKYYIVKAGDRFVGDNSIYLWRSGSSTYMRTIEILRPAKYAMTFAKGDEGASGTMDAQSVIEKSLVTLPACTFTAPEGKEFDAWVVTKTAGGAAVSVTDGKFTMPQEAVTLTATWKTLVVKYAVTYVLNGPTGDTPTETNKAEDAEFSLAAAPSWAGHVFKGWQWTDGEEVTHLEAAASSFTMPAYAVTFTAQWKLENDAAFSNKVAFENAEVDLSSLFTSSSDGDVTYALKVASETASISGATFTATAAGEYVVVASQAATDTYAATSKEATIEVLETEVEDIFIFNKKADYGGEGKCLTAVQANTDDGAHQYTSTAYEGFAAMGRATTDNTECTLTFSVKAAYSSALAIKSICTYGKLEEPNGAQISWDGGTTWENLAKYSDAKKEFDAPGTYPTSFKIKFLGVSKSSGGLWWRNALVTLEKKKAITNTAIDLTAVKINNVAISAANLTTLKTADAYALDLSGEYVTAPTVKFNKLTVITYEDDSEFESNVEIPVVATVNAGGKWEAQAEINDITYTVTMAKADAFVVNYYEADGETLIGSENVAVNGNPTGTGIAPTPIDYKESYWTLNSAEVALNTITSDEAGTIINLVAAYRTAYATSINIEKWVLDNRKNNTAFRAVLDARHYQYANLNDLDSLTTDKNESDRNYPFLGQKWKLAASEISFLLQEGKTVKVRFGNMGSSVNVKIGTADAVELTSGTYANASLSSTKEYTYTATEDVVVKFQGTGTGTVVFKQIMINEDIETIKLPAIVTYDANGGSFGKTSEKYTGTPLVIADATPADEDYEFEGWHLGSVEGTKIDASAYAPTKNVTLVAKYVAKPSPFSLSTLTYKIGTGSATAVGYEEGTYEYDVELPYAGTYETITVAYTLAEGTSSVKAGAVLDVMSVPGAATFTVIAANETEKTYTVNFKKEAKDGLEIIGATVSTNTTADMSGLYGGTASVNLNSKKIDNGGYIYITLPSGYTFEETDVLVVNVNTKADIGTKALEITTGVGNIDGEVWKTIAFDDYSTGNNTIALTGIVANQTSIGLKRSSNQNAKINSLKVYRPMNPVLKSITFDGTKIDVTGLTVEETLPYSADLTAVTPEIFWNGAGTAVVTTNAGAWAWGDNTFVLTDKDGDATPYTITLVRAERSSDKTLSSLTVDGNAIALEEGVYNYTYVYPYGTDPATVPAVAAVANDAHASVGTITQAGSTAGTASFTVTAEDETEQEYTVSFKISRVPGLVIYDGSTGATAFTATSYEDDDTHFAWSIGSSISVSADNAPANSTWGGKTYTKILKGFKPKNGNNEVSFTVPTGYLAKIRLVGSTNNDGDSRKMFIAEEATNDASKAIGNYVITSSTYEAQGFVTELLMPGTYFLGSTDSYRLFEFSAQLYPIDYSREVTQNIYGTICLPNGGIMVGATIFEVAHMTYENAQPYKVFFDEVLDGVMEAGMPYIFLPKEDVAKIAVTYTDEENASAGNKNGLHGTLSRIDGEDLYGKYIFYNNSIFMSENLQNWLNANRAYIQLSEVPDYVTPVAQGRRRVAMGFNGTNTATGFDQVTSGQVLSTKLLIDGKMYILRGEKMFDATGRLVK